jgi:hypothetical protein
MARTQDTDKSLPSNEAAHEKPMEALLTGSLAYLLLATQIKHVSLDADSMYRMDFSLRNYLS